MFILYDLIFFIFAIIYLPYLIFKGKLHPGLYSRLGELSDYSQLDQPIWLHAVSVGETMAIRSLAESLRKKYPSKKLAISTVTPTGNRIAKAIAREGDYVFYLPFDLSIAVKRVIRKIDPSLFIIIETEIWPNLISYLYQKRVPVLMVNGRISERSFKGYRILSFLLKPVLNKISLFCVQTEKDSERLIKLGAIKDRVKVTGNMKFDLVEPKKDCADYKEKLGLGSEDNLLIAGSTHPGEEEMILNTYRRLSNDYHNLKLLIAPRHPQRSKDVEKIAINYGFSSLRISQLDGPAAGKADRSAKIFILDSVGRLLSFYDIADIVFVGGSLVKRGGHNILEPALFAKPILIGPHMFNFRDIAEVFLNHQAAVCVKDSDQLYENIRLLLDNPKERKGLGERARRIISQKRGSTEENLEWISYIFSGT